MNGIWVDSDMGVDDLFAVLALSAHCQIAGLSLSFGCAPLDRAVENAGGARDRFGWTFPIAAGAARPFLGPVETAERVLGPRGLPTRGRSLPVGLSGFPVALPWLERWCTTASAVLALGPLTNLATLALARPDLTLPPITWMGGSLGRGNHTAHAEFNALADPLALAILLDRGADLTMIDLEACRRVRLTETDLADIADPLLADLLGGYLDIGLSRGRDHMALYDPVAAAALVRPKMFTFTETPLSVDVSDGPKHGSTRPGGTARVRIVRDLDADAVLDWCLAPLAAYEATQ